MKIHTIDTGNFKLDGGAMFGVVPKTIWQKINPADQNNMCSWAMRCLLVEYADRLVLVDTGIGDKQSEKFFSYYYLHGDATLKGSLAKLGFAPDDVTDVLLTHLHFDHCGGAVVYNRSKERYEPAFPKARYWSNTEHWKWAVEPNPREKASFLKENILPIEQSGQLHWVERDGQWSKGELFPGFRVFFANGHTESQMIPVIDTGRQTVMYCADLMPSSGHIPLPYVIGYDVRPLETMKEKEYILDLAFHEQWVLCFEHDVRVEAAVLERTERGIRAAGSGRLNEFIGR